MLKLGNRYINPNNISSVDIWDGDLRVRCGSDDYFEYECGSVEANALLAYLDANSHDILKVHTECEEAKAKRLDAEGVPR